MKKTILAAAFLLSAVLPAAAVDWSTPIRALDGTVITLSETDKSPLTLSKVSVDAMLATVQGEQLMAEDKSKRFAIAMKVQMGEQLTIEETALLKKVIGQVYGPLVVGRAYQIIDPGSVPADKPASKSSK